MAHAFCAAGGFAAGTAQSVEHQRLSGQSYCFSASMPAVLTITAIEGILKLQSKPEIMTNLKINSILLRKALQQVKGIVLDGPIDSPLIHVRLESENVDDIRRIVRVAREAGLLLTRAKYVDSDLENTPGPSIRICSSAAFSAVEMKQIVETLKSTLKSCL